MGKSDTITVTSVAPLVFATKLEISVDKATVNAGETTTIRTWITFWDTTVYPPGWRMVPGGKPMTIIITRPDGGVESYNVTTDLYGIAVMDYTFSMSGIYSIYSTFAGDATYAGCE